MIEILSEKREVREHTDHGATRRSQVVVVKVLVHGVEGLLELPVSLSLCCNIGAKLSHLFLCGHPL